MKEQISLEQISKFNEEYNKDKNNKIIENSITKKCWIYAELMLSNMI